MDEKDDNIINDIMANPNNYMMFNKQKSKVKRNITKLTINDNNTYTLALTNPDEENIPRSLALPRDDLVKMFKKNNFSHPTWRIRKINNGDTALHTAIQKRILPLTTTDKQEKHEFLKKNFEIIERLVDKMDADGLKIQNKERETALHLAVLLGHAKNNGILEMLVEKMDDEGLNIQNKDGNTALHTAIKDRMLRLARRRNPEDFLKKYIETIKRLVDKMDADGLNKQNNERETALHLAVKNNNQELVQTLIGKGADVNLKNFREEAPLDIAIKKKKMNLL